MTLPDWLAVALLIVGFLLYLEDLPHRRAGYRHRNCDVCVGDSDDE